jgi:hypothetical protein
MPAYVDLLDLIAGRREPFRKVDLLVNCVPPRRGHRVECGDVDPGHRDVTQFIESESRETERRDWAILGNGPQS